MSRENYATECEVCERSTTAPWVDERKADTWVILKDGTLEGITHCFTCKPLLLSRVERLADSEDVHLA